MHPVLFEVPTPWGGQIVYAYGVMLGLSLITGWFLLMWLGRSDGLDPEPLANAYLVSVVSGLVGARLMFVLTHLSGFDEFGSWIDVRTGGLSTEGAWLGGFLGGALYARLKGLPLLRIADAAAPGLALGLCLTRMGNYLHGSEFGVPLSGSAPAWLKAVGTFPRWEGAAARLHGSPAWRHHVETYELATDASAAFPVHPVQLYEALYAVLLISLAGWVWRRRQFAGQAFLILAVAYNLARLVLDPLIDDPERVRAFGMTLGQHVAFLLLAVLTVTWLQLHRQTRQRAWLSEGRVT